MPFDLPVPVQHEQTLQAALQKARESDAVAWVDPEVFERLLAKLLQMGFQDPDKLVDVASLMATSKLFISMVS